MSYKEHFSRFLAAAPDRLHFAAHSHHLWPDVSFDAQRQEWEDAARLADRKWELVFGEVVPDAQAHVARILGLPDPATVAFAPTTHELVMRVLSGVDTTPIRILTTDGEFHSLRRQLRRLEEAGRATVERVPVEPFDSFADRFAGAVAGGTADVVYLSHVFFDSGFVVDDLAAAVAGADPATLVVIDGYHSFMARPTDLGALADRVFYLAGGYKYAMSGEGVCFAHCPPGYCERPVDTGWFAGFGQLETLTGDGEGPVEYAPGGSRFLGATLEPTGIYRFNAVMDWLFGLGVTPDDIHRHARRLQDRFLDGLEGTGSPLAGALIPERTVSERGNFLTFRLPDAGALHRLLLDDNVITDVRGDRFRIGFGLYHDPPDVDELLTRLTAAAAALPSFSTH